MAGRFRRTLREKFIGEVLTSKRFYAIAAAVLVRLFGEKYGMTDDIANSIVMLVAGWVTGESIRPADNPLTSRRFWVMVAGIASTALMNFGMDLDPEVVQGIVLSLAAWIVGDSWRETLRGDAKQLQKMAYRGSQTSKPFV